jgi:hypothetical protein
MRGLDDNDWEGRNLFLTVLKNFILLLLLLFFKTTKRLRFMLDTIKKLPNSTTFTQVLEKRFIEQYKTYGMKPDDKATQTYTNLFNDYSISIELPNKNVTKTSAVATQSDSVVEGAATQPASSQSEAEPMSGQSMSTQKAV